MPDKSVSLKFRTWELLDKTTKTPREIAKDLGVSVQWVRLFKAHEIKSPNVDLVQRLYEYLNQAPLFKD